MCTNTRAKSIIYVAIIIILYAYRRCGLDSLQWNFLCDNNFQGARIQVNKVVPSEGYITWLRVHETYWCK